ncbi:MAG TPA: PAS domain-containing sensor histidine kinase [Planktothrix sp.]
MNLTNKLLIVLVVLLTIQLGLGATLFALHENTQAQTEKAKKSLILSDKLAKAVEEFVFLKALFTTANVGKLPKATMDFEAHLNALMPDFKDEPDKYMVVSDAREHLHVCQVIAARAQKLMASGQWWGNAEQLIWMPLRQHVLKIVDDTTLLTHIMQDQDDATQEALHNERSWREASVNATRFGIALQILIIAASFIWFQRDITRRIRIIVANTKRIAAKEPLLPMLDGLDEISRLDQSFHNIARILTTADRAEHDLIDKQRDVICQLTRDLKFLNVNRACNQSFGLSPEELTEKSLLDYVHPDDREELKQHFASSVNSTQQALEARIVRPSGAITELLWSVRWSEYGKSYFCILHDITAQKQIERLRREVVQMVGHDLKSPLSTVSVFLQLVQTPAMSELTPEGRERVLQAVTAAQQMSELIKNLLDLEMIRAGMLILDNERVSLRHIAGLVMQSLQEESERMNVAIVAPDEDVLTIADNARLTQMLQALVSNAVRRSKQPGLVKIKISKQNKMARLAVRDEGPVISPSTLANMFDAFLTSYQKGSTANLSLAVCKSLAELHGGTVTATSRGGSTTFVIELPIKDS